MGRCKAPRRRRCGTSSRSGNAADARPPPRPAGRPVLRYATYYAVRHLIDKPENRPQNVKLFLRGPLQPIDYQISRKQRNQLAGLVLRSGVGADPYQRLAVHADAFRRIRQENHARRIEVGMEHYFSCRPLRLIK
jgi:hypothetical protein